MTRPDDVTRELCTFLDISFDPVMISKLEHVRKMGDVKRYDHLANVAQPITAEGVGRGRSALTRAQRAALKAVLEPELVSWGYEPLG